MHNIVPPAIGQHYQINVPPPGAATAVSYTNSEIGRFWILGVNFKLVTDANVADRFCTVKFVVAGQYFTVSSEFSLKQTASSIAYWSASPGLTAFASTASGFYSMPLHSMLVLPKSWSLGIDARNMQAGDLFDEIVIWALRWLDPQA